MTKPARRYAWAAEILDPTPGERILEVGSGLGHMIPLVLPRLEHGSYTVIERSGSMYAALCGRFTTAIADGTLALHRLNFPESSLPHNSFDKIFVFNLNVFWMDPRDELRETARLLTPGGRFFIFHRPPPGHELGEFAEAFRSNLQKYGFEVEREIFETSEGVNSLAIVSFIARP